MKITLATKAGDKLANLLCEVDALIHDGTIKVGCIGISPDSAEYCHVLEQFINHGLEVKEVIIVDSGLKL